MINNSIATFTLNPCVDKTIWVDALQPETKLVATKIENEPGGGGINVSRALQFNNIKSNVQTLLGGNAGEVCKQLLHNEGIEILATTTLQETRTNLLIIDENTGLEYRIGMPNPKIEVIEIESFISNLKKLTDTIWVASGSIPSGVPSNIYATMANICKSISGKFIVDTSKEALQQVLQSSIYLLKPNLQELAFLVGKKSLEVDEVLAACQQILATYENIEAIAVSMGANGAILSTKTQAYKATPPNVTVKSTVGAGDTMVAGMTNAIANNKHWGDVIKQGVAWGTATTLNSGKELCKPNDIEIITKQVVVERLH
jgi:6-phosphofructokinase 2